MASGMSREGGNLRLHVVVELGHFLQTPEPRLGKHLFIPCSSCSEQQCLMHTTQEMEFQNSVKSFLGAKKVESLT